jgi:hypothetical protein
MGHGAHAGWAMGRGRTDRLGELSPFSLFYFLSSFLFHLHIFLLCKLKFRHKLSIK